MCSLPDERHSRIDLEYYSRNRVSMWSGLAGKDVMVVVAFGFGFDGEVCLAEPGVHPRDGRVVMVAALARDLALDDSRPPRFGLDLIADRAVPPAYRYLPWRCLDRGEKGSEEVTCLHRDNSTVGVVECCHDLERA